MKAAEPAIDDESRRITENSRKRKAEKQKQRKREHSSKKSTPPKRGPRDK